MKNKTEQSNSFKAPLLELVIIIGIFAIVSIYLLRMFMVADRLQGKAGAITKSLVRAESVAESIRGGSFDSLESLKKSIADKYNMEELVDGSLVIGYSKSWKQIKNDETYIMVVKLNEENGLATGDVSVLTADRSIVFCKLELSKALNR